jgi:hypothetical protein
MACLHASNVGRKKPAPAGQVRYEKVCEQCAKPFRVTKTRMDTARFCSRACQSASPAWQQECKQRVPREQHWRWQGGKYKDKSVYVRTDRRAGTVAEHRQLFAAHMAANAPGHPFLYEKDGVWRIHQHIHVHHVDENPKNNELGNLLALTAGAHAKLHHSRRKPEPWECWPPNPEKW